MNVKKDQPVSSRIDAFEERREISVDSLFEEHASFDVIVDAPPIERLPYGEMPWDRFESLCAHVLNDDRSLRITQAWLYGREGQNQHGIDILAFSEHSGRHVVAQSKRVRKMDPADVTVWTDRFLLDKRAATTARFIIFLACRFSETTKTLENWDEALGKFDAAGIKAEVWDQEQLDRILRDRPAIVHRFFGPERTKRFCTPAFPTQQYPSQFRTQYVGQWGNQLVIENVSSRLELNLPNVDYPDPDALFSFARQDLSGISFAVDPRTLVLWARWITMVDPVSHDRPYASASSIPDRYTMAAGRVGLTLHGTEVQELDWVLLQAWKHFLPQAEALEQLWRFLRFARASAEDKVFALATASRHSWQCMLDFANAHDHEDGTTVQHIFDQSRGMLKIFNRTTRLGGKRDPHHVIIRAYADGGMTLPWEGDDVRLVWEPGVNVGGSLTPVGPDDAWDAERTHDWLFSTLRPWVESYINGKIQSRRKWKPFAKKPEKEFELSLRSTAIYERRDLHSARSAQELCELCTFFQGHFHLNLSGLPVSTEMTINVIKLAKHFLRFMGETDQAYIAGNLGVGSENLHAALPALLASTTVPFHLPARLDRALAALVFLLRKVRSLPQSDIEFSLDLLRPVAVRVREDLLCESLTKSAAR